MKHDHYFATDENETIMTDNFYFRSPLGLLGKLVDRILLKKYLTGLLIKRNEIIKQFAESEGWKTVLP
jgi:ligand-binding SRPBCC domain-containing protein